MSSFYCAVCGASIIDTPDGYVTGCEHHPLTPPEKKESEMMKPCEQNKGYYAIAEALAALQAPISPTEGGVKDISDTVVINKYALFPVEQYEALKNLEEAARRYVAMRNGEPIGGYPESEIMDAVSALDHLRSRPTGGTQ